MWIYRISVLLIVAVVSLTLRSLLLPPLFQALQTEKLNEAQPSTSANAIEQQTSQLNP